MTSLPSTPLLVSYQVSWVATVSLRDLERDSKGISSVLGCPAHFAVGNLKPHLGLKVEPPPLHSTVLGPLRAAWLLPWGMLGHCKLGQTLKCHTLQSHSQPEEEEGEEEEEAEELGHAETYADYVPSKCKSGPGTG